MTAAIQLKENSRRRKRVFGYRTLVLNADGRPLSTWPLHMVSAVDAISTLGRDKAVVVDTWKDAFFRSPSTTIGVPKVVMLREFRQVYGRPKFTRRSIYLRDNFRCQYCGEKFEWEELTFDHVHPRSKGGKTWWDNIATACLPCNTRKENGDKMKPVRQPFEPTNMQLLQAGLEFLPNNIREDFSSWLYWSSELKV